MSETRVPSSQAEMRDTEVAVSPPAAAPDIAIGIQVRSDWRVSP
jgi:hypothetical protein